MKKKNNNKTKLNKNNEISEENKKRKPLKKIFSTCIVCILIFFVVFGYTTLQTKKLVTSIANYKNSIIVDNNGNTIAVLGSERKQEKISIENIPENLKNAYIAIEDKRFYSHHGVDIKRTGGAVITYITHRGSSSFGGSTITQQLVKNITGDNKSNITRKIQEWSRACQVELFMNKDEILEAYFNIIYVGPNIYGVNLGAKYYFNKNVSDLSLAECAFLAGLNNSPNSYNPFSEKDNKELINKRTKTVLQEMKNQNMISDEEYNLAITEVEQGLNFENGAIEANGDGIYSYHTDALINELIKDISKKYYISDNFAKNYIYLSGFKIYSNQDSNIQQIIEEECNKKKYILKSKNVEGSTTQSAVIIIEPESGYVVGCSGGLGEKNTARGLNRATQITRQTGSAGKPIAVLAPAISKKIITPASIYIDEETTFEDGEDGYTPTDYNGFQGKMSVRRAVESSQNIPFVKIMEEVTPNYSIKFMRKMGITSLTKVDDNINLALGGLDKGISPLEMAGAYNTISNDGIYIEPTFYKKVEDENGNLILKSKQTKRRVLSKQEAYILKSLLKQPVEGKNGTAVYCKINNMDVAAKTGTTNENYDRWLCGFTNYYTGVVWYGYDKNETIEFSGNNPAGIIWSEIMKKIHANFTGSEFEKPSGIVELAVCEETGEIATHNCPNTYTEVFIDNNVPNECSVHKEQ